MFDRILALLHMTPTEFTSLPEADARHAMGALLVRVAKADGAYLFQEIEEIDHVLADIYRLTAIEAAKMRAECEKLETAMPDTNELAHILACDVANDERSKFVTALWKIADADGQRHGSEEHVVAIATETFGMAAETAVALRT